MSLRCVSYPFYAAAGSQAGSDRAGGFFLSDAPQLQQGIYGVPHSLTHGLPEAAGCADGVKTWILVQMSLCVLL